MAKKGYRKSTRKNKPKTDVAEAVPFAGAAAKTIPAKTTTTPKRAATPKSAPKPKPAPKPSEPRLKGLLGKVQDWRNRANLLYKSQYEGLEAQGTDKFPRNTKTKGGKTLDIVGKKPNTPEEIRAAMGKTADYTITGLKARPVDFIEPYYGKDFPEELFKARVANKEVKALEPDAYKKLFDEVPTVIKNRSSNYYSTKSPVVTLGDADSKKIKIDNAKKRNDVLNKSKAEFLKKYPSWKEEDGEDVYYGYKDFRKDARDLLIANSYKRAEGIITPAAEHEFMHHATQPAKDTDKLLGPTSKWYMYDEEKGYPSHGLRPSETTLGLAKTNREFFKHQKDTTGVGRRMEAKDLQNLIDGDEKDLEFLSREGQRSIRALRQLKKVGTDKEYKTRLKRSKEILPALVENQPSKDVLKSGILRRMYA